MRTRRRTVRTPPWGSPTPTAGRARGGRFALGRVDADEKTDGYDTAGWSAGTDGRQPPRRLTGGTRDHSPRWSPDGRRVAVGRPGAEGGPGPAAPPPGTCT